MRTTIKESYLRELIKQSIYEARKQGGILGDFHDSINGGAVNNDKNRDVVPAERDETHGHFQGDVPQLPMVIISDFLLTKLPADFSKEKYGMSEFRYINQNFFKVEEVIKDANKYRDMLDGKPDQASDTTKGVGDERNYTKYFSKDEYIDILWYYADIDTMTIYIVLQDEYYDFDKNPNKKESLRDTLIRHLNNMFIKVFWNNGYPRYDKALKGEQKPIFTIYSCAEPLNPLEYIPDGMENDFMESYEENYPADERAARTQNTSEYDDIIKDVKNIGESYDGELNTRTQFPDFEFTFEGKLAMLQAKQVKKEIEALSSDEFTVVCEEPEDNSVTTDKLSVPTKKLVVDPGHEHDQDRQITQKVDRTQQTFKGVINDYGKLGNSQAKQIVTNNPDFKFAHWEDKGTEQETSIFVSLKGKIIMNNIEQDIVQNTDNTNKQELSAKRQKFDAKWKKRSL